MSCFRYVRTGRAARGGVDINMAPLIDMVFILLIFFIVTASFTREAGVDVQRPEAATAEQEQRPLLQVGVTAEGRVFVEGASIDLRAVRARVAAFLAVSPDGGVLVVADRASRTDDVIRVIDQCRLAGARNVGIAAQRSE
ncbi:ExbD/TolR family protein [Paucidesulfovibrio longus]|uniref:ExbD/TolR family protein n=1 Tax=Paucidesulfovibrio longus TaxID=889 RepID=UPI0003B2E68B|nr:biopolymer transporter ExbD [Paucidesulfovibrio longus]